MESCIFQQLNAKGSHNGLLRLHFHWPCLPFHLCSRTVRQKAVLWSLWCLFFFPHFQGGAREVECVGSPPEPGEHVWHRESTDESLWKSHSVQWTSEGLPTVGWYLCCFWEIQGEPPSLYCYQEESKSIELIHSVWSDNLSVPRKNLLKLNLGLPSCASIRLGFGLSVLQTAGLFFTWLFKYLDIVSCCGVFNIIFFMTKTTKVAFRRY